MTSLTEELLVREIDAKDVGQLRPILEASIVNPETGLVIDEEVESCLKTMREVANGRDNNRIYDVAVGAGGVVLGIMGLTDADKRLSIASSNVEIGASGEIINAFVDPKARGIGVGKALVHDIVHRHSKRQQYEDVVVMSGPRYRETGWPFWTSQFGPPVTTLRDAFGPGKDAPVWRKEITG